MRYQMKQRLFAWGDDFVIKDAEGRDAFFVDGRAFSLGKQVSFQDMEGRELAFIQQKLLSWGPTYEIRPRRRDPPAGAGATVRRRAVQRASGTRRLSRRQRHVVHV
jgi:uncharacterized protein YxjI